MVRSRWLGAEFDSGHLRGYYAGERRWSGSESLPAMDDQATSTSEGSGKELAGKERQLSDLQLMKERFAKLLLGEDMSGGGKGVSSALAVSNAITNLAASVFGEQKRLEPMSAETKKRWRKEIEWLLSVTDYIVEFFPSMQKLNGGITMEVMSTRQRRDLHMNIPALRKLDTMLLDCLDSFEDQNEFHYASNHEAGESAMRQEDKWWIPTPKVPPTGLSDTTRKWLLQQKDSVHQVLKAAMAINAHVLSEMEIPESYIESLPKNGRSSLGDSMYRIITDEQFDPDYFLSCVDMSSEHKIVDLKNKLEASVVIWKRKLHSKDAKPAWGSTVSLEKREVIEERAEMILLLLKHRFPGLPQSDLDISKIHCNRDVGQAILESYSRVIEGLAFTILSRIDDVMHADSLARSPRMVHKVPGSTELQSSSDNLQNGKEDSAAQLPSTMMLMDFMGWTLRAEETEVKKEFQCVVESIAANTNKDKKMTYTERLENSVVRSPTARD